MTGLYPYRHLAGINIGNCSDFVTWVRAPKITSTRIFVKAGVLDPTKAGGPHNAVFVAWEPMLPNLPDLFLNDPVLLAARN